MSSRFYSNGMSIAKIENIGHKEIEKGLKDSGYKLAHPVKYYVIDIVRKAYFLLLSKLKLVEESKSLVMSTKDKKGIEVKMELGQYSVNSVIGNNFVEELFKQLKEFEKRE